MTSAVPAHNSTGTRLPYLDGLRAAAALFVLFHHAFMMAYPDRFTGHVPGWVGRVFGWMIWGHFGVTAFIVLAGYSLMLGLAKHDGQLPEGFLGYMRKRSWRIIPPFWIALTITIVLTLTVIGDRAGTHWDQSVPPEPKGWIVQYALLRDFIPVRNAAYTFWSISVEYHIYLLIPFMLIFWRRWNWLAAVALGASVGVTGIVLAHFDGRFWRLWPSYYLLFALAAGACVATYRYPVIAARIPWRTTGVLTAITAIVALWVGGYSWATAQYWWLDLLIGTATICLIVSMERGDAQPVAKRLAWKPLAAVAAFSYSMYLIHAQLLQLLWQLIVRPLHLGQAGQMTVLWLAICPVIVGLSWLFYLIAERPFVRKAASKKPSPATTDS